MTRVISLALAIVLLSFISTFSSIESPSRYTAAATTTSYLMCDPELGDCSTSDGHGDTTSLYNDLDMEMLMDSEISRRILASSSRYISYGALSPNRVPCSTAGRSYYYCRSSGRANPYTRGCSRITRCYRDTS